MFQYSLRMLLLATCASALLAAWLRAELSPLLREEAAIRYWEQRIPPPREEFSGPGWGICWHYHRPWWVRCLGLRGFRRAYALSLKQLRLSPRDRQQLDALSHLHQVWIDGQRLPSPSTSSSPLPMSSANPS